VRVTVYDKHYAETWRREAAASQATPEPGSAVFNGIGGEQT